MVLEDLGDEMLETRLLAGDAARRRCTSAPSTSSPGCARTPRRGPSGCVAFGRGFDRDLYRWELDHFVEWGLEAWKGARLVRRRRRRWSTASSTASRGRSRRSRRASRTVTTSRGTSWCCPSGEQVVIDFQDALLGPRQYDLVALLRDSYVELEAALVEAMLRRYLERLARRGRAAPRVRAVPRGLRPPHRPAQAEGRGPLRLHRPREEEPGLPPVDPGLAPLRARRVRAPARSRRAPGGPRAARARAGALTLGALHRPVGEIPRVEPAPAGDRAASQPRSRATPLPERVGTCRCGRIGRTR